MVRLLSTLADLIAWVFLLGVWLALFALINPADAADLTAPVSVHAARHASVLFLLALAAALVAIAMRRKWGRS